ncbi:MAG: outer membrane beta-barrel protein, partial [Chlorobi bacterium]|nr:outer membrane beta-barrel protein [Chlorobiota bacterium]
VFLPVFILFISPYIYGQADTTEFKVGNKKLIIIDKKIQKQNALYNLEKAKESFAYEIAEAEKQIKTYEEIIKQREKLIKEREEVLKNKENIIKQSDFGKTADYTSEDLNNLLKQRMERMFYLQDLERLKSETEHQKFLIELNRKKIEAFEKGLEDIDKSIAEVKKEISGLNKELKIETEKKSRKEVASAIKHQRFNAHWAGFELGILNFTDSKGNLLSDDDLGFLAITPEKTISYALNIIEYNIPLSKNKLFGLATGAGMEWNSIALKENINLYEDENGNLCAEYVNPDDIKYTKNKLNVAYVTVPLIIEIQIPTKKRRFFFGAGITGSIRTWSKQKQKYTSDGETYKNKIIDDFRLSPFKYGATARIGYGDIAVYVNYDFISLFRTGTAPEMFPVSVGFKIADF